MLHLIISINSSNPKLVWHGHKFTPFENALDRYRIDIGKYPETRQGLSALVTQPAGIVNWNGPYLRKAIPKDPWGSDYQYRKADDEKAIILSLGADKKAGGQNTDADITNN